MSSGAGIWAGFGFAAAIVLWLSWPAVPPVAEGGVGKGVDWKHTFAPPGLPRANPVGVLSPSSPSAAAAPPVASAAAYDSRPLYVEPRLTSEDEIKSTFVKNPSGRLADVSVPEVQGVDYKMFVHDPKYCKYISKSILEQHSWEGDHARRLINAMNAVNGGGSMLDIGANVGYFGISVAAAGFNVVGVEPALYNTELISASIAISGLQDRFRLYKSAVSNEPAEALCAMPNEAVGGDASHNQGNFQLRPVADCTARGDSYKGSEIVPVQTIDSILAGDPAVASTCFDALKIDVEGFETKALQGSSSVLRGKCPPCFVLLEYINQPSLFELLVDDLGYVCAGLGHKRANGQWKVAPMEAKKPYGSITDQDFQCKLVSDARCDAVSMQV